jgi:hypothetical protein
VGWNSGVIEEETGSRKATLVGRSRDHTTHLHAHQEGESSIPTNPLYRHPSTAAGANTKEDLASNSSTIWKGECGNQIETYHQEDGMGVYVPHSHSIALLQHLFPLRVVRSILCSFLFVSLVSSELCDDIADLRRKIQRLNKAKVLFLDETQLKLNAAPTHTLVALGEKEYVVVEDTSAYAKRYDMIACITSKEVLPPIIYTPDERKTLSVRGINTKMLVTYIQQILAQACGALDRYPLYLILDKATCHSKSQLLEAFHDNGCQSLVDIWSMPTQAAKRMSPLDNSLFHEWKERVRNRHPITSKNIEQLMSDEWNNIPPQHLSHYYQHCGLTGRGNVYFDCPQPSVHKHQQ